MIAGPPQRLRHVPQHWGRRLRLLWIVAFALAAITVVASTLYAMRATYELVPAMTRHGLDFSVDSVELLVVGTAQGRPDGLSIPARAKVVAVDGRPVPPDIAIAELVERLDAPGQTPSTVTLRQPGGQLVKVPLQAPNLHPTAKAQRDRDIRMWMRLGMGLLSCIVLLSCSLLLALRRPNDLVAMLLAFSFAGMAATVDPPLQFWMWTDRSLVSDVVSGVFYYFLVIALAAFPDGVFIPRWMRWAVVVGIPASILSNMVTANEDLQGISAVAILLLIVTAQVIRFRRQPPGIERQQIKWAGFGFAVGLLLIMGAVLLAAAVSDPATASPIVALTIILLFSAGVTAFPLGLLIALLRFRLWEADAVISRSAGYAVVTVVVGVVWAASSDLAKMAIGWAIGPQGETAATTVGAIIAAGFFAPTQSLVMGWTKRRFGGARTRLGDLRDQLDRWKLTDTPKELGSRALAIVDRAVHPGSASIVLLTPDGEEQIAQMQAAEDFDHAVEHTFELRDDEGPVGSLILGKRSDGNRYNREQLDSLREVTPRLADALRASRNRFMRESGMQQMIEQMQARIAQLEAGPGPAPA